MRNAKLLLLTLVSAVTALGCSVRTNAHPEYAAPTWQAPVAETFAVPYKNAWDSNAGEVEVVRARPSSVGAAAEAVKSPVVTPASGKPIKTKQVLQERFGLR